MRPSRKHKNKRKTLSNAQIMQNNKIKLINNIKQVVIFLTGVTSAILIVNVL